jgi:hypothetical protein
MSSAPQFVVDLVWERILFFAMFAADVKPPCEGSLWPEITNSNRLNILLVSKTFKVCIVYWLAAIVSLIFILQTLALPYLYGYPIFLDDISLQKFSARLCADPTLGLHIRELRISRLSVPKRRKSKFQPDLIPIFSRAPGLTRLLGRDISLTWNAFGVLARTVGETLAEFTGFGIESDPQIKRHLPTIFKELPALQSLGWNADGAVVADQAPGSSTEGALPSLGFLTVESSGLLPALSLMR